MNKEVKGTILILTTALISGIAIVINKFFVAQIDPLILTATRALVIGLAFLLISLLVTNKQKFNKASWKSLLGIGIIGGGLAFWIFFTGLKMTTAGRAAFLHKTLPIYAVVLAFIFLKEKITKQQLITIGIMLTGLVILEIPNLPREVLLGDLLILGATFLWAIENTISKKVMLNKENNWVVTFSRMFFGSLLLFAIILLTGKFHLLASLTTKQIIYIAISGTSLFLYVLTWYWGLKYINLSKASTILLLAPVISLSLGVIWLKETIYEFQIIGSLLILIGGFFMIKFKSENRIKKTNPK